MGGLRIQIEEPDRDGHGVARLLGEFDMSDGSAFARCVTDGVLVRTCTQLDLDVRELTFVDSTGLRGLIEARKRADTLGIRLSLVGVQPPFRRLLEITNLADWFDRT